MSSCIICLKYVTIANCLNWQCNNKMCNRCNEIILNTDTELYSSLPFINNADTYINWTCTWNCLYTYNIDYFGKMDIPLENTEILAINKQRNILQQIQLPIVLASFLQKDIMNIVMEYSECLLREIDDFFQ